MSPGTKRSSRIAPSRAPLAFLAIGFTAAAFLAAGCAPEEGADDGAQAGEAAAEAGADAGSEMGSADDSAAVLADRAMEAMGGRSAWDSARFIAFDWIVDRGETQVRRSHAWDRWEGTYRLAWDQEGEPRVAIFDVNDVRRDSVVGKVPAGDVWAGGERLEGTAADSALHRAYATFINDSYWLLMPYKWRDPGVHLEYAGRDTLPDGEVAPSVHLTFEEDLGVTNDQYWAWVNPETGLMQAWQYHLQGQEEPGAVIRWEGWERVGPIRLATDRVWPDGSVNIRFENLRASAEVPEDAFAPPTGTAGADAEGADASDRTSEAVGAGRASG